MNYLVGNSFALKIGVGGWTEAKKVRFFENEIKIMAVSHLTCSTNRCSSNN